MSETVLETENLDKTYTLKGRQVRALSGVSLKITKGDFVSVMGPSGSGKTTLLNVLGCLDKPTHGKVVLDNTDVTKVPEGKLCNIRKYKVGFVFQTFNLMPWLNAVENIELPMEGTKKSKAERRKDHRPSGLSAGEQQRVAIARALANDPAIILADEPTGNLDSKAKYDIVRLLAKLNNEQGTTIIMVTHDSHMAARAGRMLFLSDGKLLPKEKQGVHFLKKGLSCASCGRELQPEDTFCPSCGKRL
jgi:putative ABC transport system ATP-binding protein